MTQIWLKIFKIILLFSNRIYISDSHIFICGFMKGGSISIGIVILLLFACFQVGAIEISSKECSCNNIVDNPNIKTNSGDYALGWLATSLAEEPNAEDPIVLPGNAPIYVRR